MDQRPTVSGYPAVKADDVGWLDEDQMIEVDRVMIEDLRIELIQMMENAGRNLATLTIDRFRPGSVTVLAGSGGNGGGGLVAARHLANRGVDVSVTLGRPAEQMTGVPGHQLDILQRMGVDVNDEPRPAAAIIDAMIGYSLRGAPRGRIAELMAWLALESAGGADGGSKVVSLDTPSGLNVTDGSSPGAVVLADATLTLAMPKVGLRNAAGVGELFIGDISVPPSVYETAWGNAGSAVLSRTNHQVHRLSPVANDALWSQTDDDLSFDHERL